MKKTLSMLVALGILSFAGIQGANAFDWSNLNPAYWGHCPKCEKKKADCSCKKAKKCDPCKKVENPCPCTGAAAPATCDPCQKQVQQPAPCNPCQKQMQQPAKCDPCDKLQEMTK